MPTYTLRNYLPLPFSSEETLAFEAQLCADGDVIGGVSNAGRGGANAYYFTDADAGQAFREHCLAWGAANLRTFEPEDAFVAELIEDIELADEARSALQSLPAGTQMMLAESDAEFVGADRFFRNLTLVAVLPGADPAAVATSAGAERWRILPA